MERKTKKDYHITSIRMLPAMKKQVRLLAVENDMSMTSMTEKLIAMGLVAYDEKGSSPAVFKEVVQ